MYQIITNIKGVMNYTQLSKQIAYILRHNPQEFNLKLDPEGWIPINQLIQALKTNPQWQTLTSKDIEKVTEQSDKKRYEIADNKIRAFYGLSTLQKIQKQSQSPPEFLYHGTTKTAAVKIQNTGLKSQSRQYVHLSQDIETAIEVGKRRQAFPILFIVHAQNAYNDGINFYLGNETIWLADEIPVKYLSVTDSDK